MTKLAGGRPRPDCGQYDLALAFLAAVVVIGIVVALSWVAS